MKSVGGGTRGEPLVASLLSYMGYLLLSFINNQWKVDESVWINGIGALFYVVYLMLFLITIDHTDQRITLMTSVLAAVVYFTLIVAAGLLTGSIVALKWLCMLAGLASAWAPLLLALFMVEKYVENLPDSFSSASGLFYYIVWMARACVPEANYFDLVTNFLGAVCSSIFLFMLFKWRNQNKPQAEQGIDIGAPLLPNQNQPEAEQGNAVAALLPNQNQVQQGANPPDPVDLQQQVDQQQPVDPLDPADLQQPVDPPNPADLQQPVDPPNPVNLQQPVDPPNPIAQHQPVDPQEPI